MDEIFSKFTDQYNCESSDRIFNQNPNDIEYKFRLSHQNYVFPRLPYECDSSNSNSSIQSVVDLNCIKQTIESPQRLKTEGNEKSEDQLDLNFNFNSSSEISEDVVVLQPRPYKQKLKPPVAKKPQPYQTILNDLERKLQTLNKPKRSIKLEIGRVKSNSNSATNYNSQHYRKKTPSQTKSIVVSESKKSLAKKHDTLSSCILSMLQKQKSKSHERPIFNVNNSNINLNVNINSNTLDLPRKQHTVTVAQILKNNKNRSSVSSQQQQRNSNRCSTEPEVENRFKKKKGTAIRCNTGIDAHQSTQQYLTSMCKQQQSYQQQHLQQQQRKSSKGSSKYKKPHLKLE